MKLFFGILFILLWPLAGTQAADIEIIPTNPIQGEAILITVNGLTNNSNIKSLTFGKQTLNFFVYAGKISALGAIDLSQKVGTSTISVKFKNNTKILKDIYIAKRPLVEAHIDIPKKLGGNTVTAVKKLVANLINEQAIIGKITSIIKPKAFWRDNFVFPIKNPEVTDSYGYSRDTVGYSITHKGTDFHANVGTPVLAINRGVVRDVRTYPSFGKTIIVDHGLGLYSMYMHLSKIKVNVGELVLPEQVIALSGDSGYATGPHLHLTIRINGISIDPIKFYGLFGVKI
ncbi:MAG: M23 family metallopeptidase [bacterium]|nr:M23 family metallopeptidase [bacterium]